MGKGISYCSICGDRILEKDFDSGRAVTILRKDYCKKCSKDVITSASTKGQTVEPAETPSPRKLQTRRIPSADNREGFSRKLGVPMPYLIAIIIGIVAVVLLLYILSRGSHPA